MSRNPKEIAKRLIRIFRELDRKGDLARDGTKIAKVIEKLRKERRLSREELDRPMTL